MDLPQLVEVGLLVGELLFLATRGVTTVGRPPCGKKPDPCESIT